jgi:hypothetical protein
VCLAGLDWAKLYNKALKVPFVPDLSSPGDTRNFESYPDSTIEESGPLLSEAASANFAQWTDLKK